MGEIETTGGGMFTSPFDRIKRVDADGQEYWSARELMPELGYSSWENMLTVIKKVKAACRTTGIDHELIFIDTTKNSKSVGRAGLDVRMTRYACYLVTLNADSAKPEVAAAKHYFAVMTRAQELGRDASLRPRVARAWSERFDETIQPHMLAMNVGHPDCFSVVTALVPQMLILEDELIRHLFDPTPSDRPDVSIGLCWANHRRSRGLPDTDRFAPLHLPGRPRPVMVGVYGNRERGLCERWFNADYLPEKLPEYLRRKPEFRAFGELPPASVADVTCRKLTGQPARLKPIVHRQLAVAGGFFPVGAEVPMLSGSQPTLFY